MRLAFITLVSTCALLGACSDRDADRSDAAVQANGAVTPAASQQSAPGANAGTAAPIAALGLTLDQLGDADILDASGAEIAEVERVITDASGRVTGLLIEIEDTDPDRHVTIPLDGLTVVTDADDQDLRSGLTRAQLLAMPAASR